MGTVHCTQGHHGLYCGSDKPDLSQRVLLSPELIDAPIMSSGSDMKLARASRASMIRGALRGLQMLKGFDAAVSLITKVDKNVGPYLLIPHRMWGEISLGDPANVVVTFSHDSRYANEPFVAIYQWLEELSPDARVADEVFCAFEREWSSPQKWHAFFESRIRRHVANLRGLAGTHRQKAEHFESTTAGIEAVLT